MRVCQTVGRSGLACTRLYMLKQVRMVVLSADQIYDTLCCLPISVKTRAAAEHIFSQADGLAARVMCGLPHSFLMRRVRRSQALGGLLFAGSRLLACALGAADPLAELCGAGFQRVCIACTAATRWYAVTACCAHSEIRCMTVHPCCAQHALRAGTPPTSRTFTLPRVYNTARGSSRLV